MWFSCADVKEASDCQPKRLDDRTSQIRTRDLLGHESTTRSHGSCSRQLLSTIPQFHKGDRSKPSPAVSFQRKRTYPGPPPEDAGLVPTGWLDEPWYITTGGLTFGPIAHGKVFVVCCIRQSAQTINGRQSVFAVSLSTGTR